MVGCIYCHRPDLLLCRHKSKRLSLLASIANGFDIFSQISLVPVLISLPLAA